MTVICIMVRIENKVNYKEIIKRYIIDKLRSEFSIFKILFFKI